MSLLARAGSFSFGHLMGLGGKPKPLAAKRAETEEDENEAARRAEDDEEAKRAEEEKPDHYDDDGKGEKEEDEKEARAESDEDERRREEDDDDEEMKKAQTAGHGKALAAARRAERRRIGRITSSPEAASRIGTALHIACNTAMSSAEAIGLLRTVPEMAKPQGGALARAMAEVKRPPTTDGGTGAPASPTQRLAAATQAVAKEIEGRRTARLGRL